jgi:hypothetical protein
MANHTKNIKVNDFDSLRNELEVKIPTISDYVFRGQSNAKWTLSSTLDRLIEHARITGAKKDDIDRFVKSHLDRFRLEIRGRRGDNPPKLADDELWALGQHFGLATPLLDWSRSPYISVFFALITINSDDSDRVLWCLNQKKVKTINSGLSEDEKLHLLFPDSDDNKRLLGQSGLFSKAPVLRSVEKWVADKSGDRTKDVLIKITFPGDRAFRKAALRNLQLMNINHSTLFPDLSGASMYCNVVAEDYEV